MSIYLRTSLTLLLALLITFCHPISAEAVWVAINTSNYTVIGGVGYINPGTTLHCYGYHEWPPFQTTTFTFSNGTNSYSVTGYNGTMAGGDFSVYMGPFAPGNNYYMSSSNGGFINGFTGPFTVGSPDGQKPYYPYMNSASSAVYDRNVDIYMSCYDNIAVTAYCLKEALSVPAKPGLSDSDWRTVTPVTPLSMNVLFPLSPTAEFKNVYVWYRDAAGNVSDNPDSGGRPNFTFQLILDTGPPTGLTMTAITPVTARKTDVTLSATDDIGVTAYKIDEPSVYSTGWVAVTSAANFSKTHYNFPLSKNPGDKTIQAWVRDAVGNVTTKTPIVVRFNDISVPTGSFTIQQPAGTVSGFFKANINLNLNASDIDSDVTHYFVQNDNSGAPTISETGWQPFTTPAQQSYSSFAASHTLTGADGLKQLYVWYKDAAGNIGAASGSPQTITLDTKMPIAGREGTGTWEYLGNPGFSRGQANYTSLKIFNDIPYVAFQDSGYGNKIVTMKFDGSNWNLVGNAEVSPGSASYTSLYIDNGIPYVSYIDDANGGFVSAKKLSGSSWVNIGGSTISSSSALWTSLSIYNDEPYVAYQDSPANGCKAVVKKYNGTNWVNIGTNGFSPYASSYHSLFIYNGIPYLAFEDGVEKAFKATVMNYQSGTWSFVGAEAFSSGRSDYHSLFIYEGIPYLAISDYGYGQKVSVFRYNGTAWQNVGPPGFSSGIANFTSLFVYNGVPYVAFHDGGNSYKGSVMKLDGNGWTYVGPPGFTSGTAAYTSLFIYNGVIYLLFPNSAESYKACVMKFEETVNDGLLINNGAKLTTVRNLKMKIFGTDWQSGVQGTGVEKYCIRCNSSIAPAAGDSTAWLNMPTVYNNTYPATQEVDFTFTAFEPDGLKIFYLWFKDKAGNVSSAAQKSIKLDTHPPVEPIAGSIAISGPHPEIQVTREVMLQLNAESGQDGTEGYYDIKVTNYFILDNNLGTTVTPPTAGTIGWQTVTTPVTPYSDIVPYTITSSSDGTKEIRVWYKDIAGNMSDSSECETYLDTSIPHGSFTINSGAEWSNSPLVTLNLNALSATAVSGYFVSENSATPSASDNSWRPVTPPVSSYTANVPYSLGRSSGVKTVYVWYKSTSGIVSAVSSDTIKLDCEAPWPGKGRAKPIVIAGDGTAGDTDGVGKAAKFNCVTGMVFDKSGNLYIADYYNNKIRKMTPDFNVTTFAGPPPGDTSEGSIDGTSYAARLRKPVGLEIDNAGNLYVGHYQECTIRKITPSGYVSTYAGTSPNVGHDDGFRTSATFYYPISLKFDKFNNLYVCDIGNYTIRKIDPSGIVSTIAGTIGLYNEINGTGFNNTQFAIHRITVDRDGNVIGADTGWDKIKKITPSGTVTIIAGPAAGVHEESYADGAASNAKFYYPTDLTYDYNDNLYVCDMSNQKIRKITPSGNVSTYADIYAAAITLSPSGELYISGYSYNAIYKLVPDTSGALDINNGEQYTNTTAIKLNLAAVDDYSGVAEYYASESPLPPDASTTWNTLTLSGGKADVNFNLSTVTKPVTVYVWFRDSAGNISSYSKKITNPRSMKAIESYGDSSTFNRPFLIARDSSENLIVADMPAVSTSPLFKLNAGAVPRYSAGSRIITAGSTIDTLREVVSGLVIFPGDYVGLVEDAKKRFAIFNAAGAFVNGFAKSVDMIANFHGANTVSGARGVIFDKYNGAGGSVNPFAEARVMANQINTYSLDLNFAAAAIEIFTDAAYSTPAGPKVSSRATLYIRVRGAGGDSTAINSIMLKAKSSDEPKGIAVQLIETSSSSDIYTGTLALGSFTNLAAGVLGAGPKNMIYLSVYSKNGILNSTMQTKPKPPSGPLYIADLGGGAGGSLFIEMVRIPAGTFVMGQAGIVDAVPTHEVTISKDFYMSKYEITQDQWLKVMGELASADKPLVSQSNTYNDGKGDNYPVYYVSWNDICDSGGNDFMTRLNAMGIVDGTFRLPTDAEWEYACRAGTTSTYYWGEDNTEATMKQYCWYGPNASSSFPWTTPHAAVSGTQSVGQKLPNAFGLYDMSGNIIEHCSDWKGVYSSAAVTDPTGPATGTFRVSRGGYWNNAATFCRSAARGGNDPSARFSGIGLRLVLPAGQ